MWLDGYHPPRTVPADARMSCDSFRDTPSTTYDVKSYVRLLNCARYLSGVTYSVLASTSGTSPLAVVTLIMWV